MFLDACSKLTAQNAGKIVSHHRPKSVVIEHARWGKAVIHDQIPMRESALKTCLCGMTSAEWYAFLNGRVFILGYMGASGSSLSRLPSLLCTDSWAKWQ